MELWMTVFDDIVKEIRNGIYIENDKLPSENVLADKYKVPRMDIRLAYKRLSEMGYIYSIQGKGRYLRGSTPKVQLHLAGNASFSQKMKEQGVDLKSKNIMCEKIPFISKIYQRLKIKSDDEVFKIGRLRYINDEPVAIHISYVAKSIFNNIAKEGTEILSMFDYYYQNGFSEFYHSYSNISALIATNYERELFNCPSITPVIMLETQCLDKNSERVLEYTEIIYRADRFTYRIDY